MDVNITSALQEVKLAMMDAAQKSQVRRLQVLQDKAPCKPACSACCSRMIYITIAEAIIIRNYLMEQKTWNDVRARAINLIGLSGTATPSTWFQMNTKCPVLDPETQLCTAYEVRPTPCSTHFVTSDPELCSPWSTRGEGQFKPHEMRDLHEQCAHVLEKVVDGHGMLAMRLILPVALLVSERIAYQSGLTVSEAVSLIHNELA